MIADHNVNVSLLSSFKGKLQEDRGHDFFKTMSPVHGVVLTTQTVWLEEQMNELLTEPSIINPQFSDKKNEAQRG